MTNVSFKNSTGNLQFIEFETNVDAYLNEIISSAKQIEATANELKINLAGVNWPITLVNIGNRLDLTANQKSVAWQINNLLLEATHVASPTLIIKK